MPFRWAGTRVVYRNIVQESRGHEIKFRASEDSDQEYADEASSSSLLKVGVRVDCLSPRN
jgi:hypothetical protein